MAAMLEDLSAYANDAEMAADVAGGTGVAGRGGRRGPPQRPRRRPPPRRPRHHRGAPVGRGPPHRPWSQLFQNLVSNALKFSRPGVAPAVEISAYERADGLVGIRVADNGIGIPANQIDKVFGLFNRAHAEGDYEGSGVGLALCRKIAIAHGGDIAVTSVPGEGTTFHIGLRGATLATAPSSARQQLDPTTAADA